MSDQEDAERELEDALDAILGPEPKDSASDVLRPIERENVRRDLKVQMRTFASANRAARIDGMQRELKRIENGIARLPLGHPLRAGPEARLAELKEALIPALESRPSDPSGISIAIATSHPLNGDLSTAERPTEADIQSGVLGTAPNEGPHSRKPARRSAKYEEIDEALLAIAAARPKNHEEVFQFLHHRKVAFPNREPFKTAGGWLKGFDQNRHAASAWLSQAWSRLKLPPFARGPKK